MAGGIAPLNGKEVVTTVGDNDLIVVTLANGDVKRVKKSSLLQSTKKVYTYTVKLTAGSYLLLDQALFYGGNDRVEQIKIFAQDIGGLGYIKEVMMIRYARASYGAARYYMEIFTGTGWTLPGQIYIFDSFTDGTALYLYLYSESDCTLTLECEYEHTFQVTAGFNGTKKNELRAMTGTLNVSSLAVKNNLIT